MKSLELLDRWIAGKIKGWSAQISGEEQTPELLEIRRDILSRIRDKLQAKGEGRSVFPFSQIEITIYHPDAGRRELLEAALSGPAGIEGDARELFTEAHCAVPPGFEVSVRAVDEESAEPFRMTFSNPAAKPPLTAAEKPVSADSSAKLTVLRGEAEPSELTFRGGRINIGRLKEVYGESDGLRRKNDLAFAETETSVSREHAYIRFDAESGKYRIFDSMSQRGTVVFREGRKYEVPRGVRGFSLQRGDEIHFGGTRVRFETEMSS